MERIGEGRIVGLSTLLMSAGAPVEPVPSGPDPALALERERADVLSKAEQDGYEHGLRRAQGELTAQLAAVEARIEKDHAERGRQLRIAQERLSGLIATWSQAVTELDRRLEETSLEIAYCATTRLLGKGAGDGELMRELCRQALIEYRQRPVLIRVAPEDLDALAAIAMESDVSVVADTRMSAGEYRLETHKGLYETGLEIRLEALKQALLSSVGTSEPAR